MFCPVDQCHLAAPLPVIGFRNGLRSKSDQSKKRLGIVSKHHRIVRKPHNHVPLGGTAGERLPAPRQALAPFQRFKTLAF